MTKESKPIDWDVRATAGEAVDALSSNEQLSPTDQLLQRVKAARERREISESLCTDIINALGTYSPVETTDRHPQEVISDVITAYQGHDEELVRRIVDALTAESLLATSGKCPQCQQTGGFHLAVCDRFVLTPEEPAVCTCKGTAHESATSSGYTPGPLCPVHAEKASGGASKKKP